MNVDRDISEEKKSWRDMGRKKSFFPFLNDFGWLLILVVKVSIIGRGS